MQGGAQGRARQIRVSDETASFARTLARPRGIFWYSRCAALGGLCLSPSHCALFPHTSLLQGAFEAAQEDGGQVPAVRPRGDADAHGRARDRQDSGGQRRQRSSRRRARRRVLPVLIMHGRKNKAAGVCCWLPSSSLLCCCCLPGAAAAAPARKHGFDGILVIASSQQSAGGGGGRRPRR